MRKIGLRRVAGVGMWLLWMASALGAWAQGGPPFITDDPATPGAGNWEINVGWTGMHRAAGGEYELPNLDMNYGWGDRLQLKYELPLAAATDADRVTRAGHLRLLLMGGRSLHRARADNEEPNWTAYLGLQLLLGKDSGTRNLP